MKTTTDKLYVPYEIAKALKLKGFIEPCFRFFNEDYLNNGAIAEGRPSNYNNFAYNKTWRNSDVDDIVSAPMYQQVLDWLRNKHMIFIYDRPSFNHNTRVLTFYFGMSMVNKQGVHEVQDLFKGGEFENYQEGLTKAIELSLTFI